MVETIVAVYLIGMAFHIDYFLKYVASPATSQCKSCVIGRLITSTVLWPLFYISYVVRRVLEK